MRCLLQCIAVASLIGFVVCSSPKWKKCTVDGHTPLFTPTSLDLNPSTVEPGSSTTFTINGKNEAHVVQGGVFEVHVLKEVYISWFHEEMELYEEEKDLCKRATCPIPTGDVTFSYKKYIPSYTPKGEYDIRLIAKEKGSNSLLMCLKLKLKVGSSHAENRKTLVAAS